MRAIDRPAPAAQQKMRKRKTWAPAPTGVGSQGCNIDINCIIRKHSAVTCTCIYHNIITTRLLCFLPPDLLLPGVRKTDKRPSIFSAHGTA